MLRKLAFLTAIVYFGKKGYDALMAVQTSSADTAAEVHSLNPVIDPEIADQIRASVVLHS